MEILKPETPLSFNIIVTSMKALTFLVFGTVFISVMAAIFWKNQTFQKIIQRLTPLINALNLGKLKKIQISPKIQAEHCSICYGSISKEVSSNCGHIFCGDCLISFWHSKKKEKISCPLCRTDINMLTAHFAHNHEDVDSKKIMEDVNRYNISCSDCPTTVLQHILGSPSSIRIFLGSLPSRRGFNSVLKGFLGTLYLLAILMYFLCPSELIPDFETIADWAGGSMSFIYLFLYIVVIFMMVA